jgi:hypothetical protein
MTEFELEDSRAKRLAKTLQEKTHLAFSNEIFVSIDEIDAKSSKFSVRLNQISNRISNVDYVTMLFLVKELSSIAYNNSGYKLDVVAKPTVHWPGIKFMDQTFHGFKSRASTFSGVLASHDMIIDHCKFTHRRFIKRVKENYKELRS